ncbi:hypothetical protein LFWB_1660 [Candidatus Phytoplasma luffae]|uniref:Uncharacterized protein n=1 Tax=Loofah witches'-broom phytoplasma TaxID=35773 RepID=A0A975IND5_LOWBP|nr:hypothetical protein [Candidatus Phytoplasma luffae]QTX02736.1 hypothetical protein LFWB_1660 [Candidatus Phytoplasma luffae]
MLTKLKQLTKKQKILISIITITAVILIISISTIIFNKPNHKKINSN